MIGADIKRACGDSKGWARISRIIRNPGLQAVIIYRFGRWLLNRSILEKILLKPLFIFLYYRVRKLWGIEISPEADIGQGFVVYHYGGILVGGDVTIGNNVSIAHGVTIGRRSRVQGSGRYIIGNDVHISPGAVIAGPLTIGDHVWIGANAVVERDIPPYALVHSQPVHCEVMQIEVTASGESLDELNVQYM